MLIESERWFTTHASLSVRARTDTGSSPTGTERTQTGAEPEASKISSRLSAVFTARSSEPPGVSVMGETWGVSQFQNPSCARAAARPDIEARTAAPKRPR